jgi:hypothetical protein
MAFGNHLLKTEVSWYKSGLVEAPIFDENTIETLCTAVIKAEDAVVYVDTAGERLTKPVTILTDTEREQMFSTVRAVENLSNTPSINADAYRRTLHSMAP